MTNKAEAEDSQISPGLKSLPSGKGQCDAKHINCGCDSFISRRDFIRWSGVAAATAAISPLPSIAGPFSSQDFSGLVPGDKKLDPAWVKSLYERGTPTTYRGTELEKIGMPIGGICAGQLYLGGDGRLWHWDIFNIPQPSNFSDTGGPNYAHPPKPHFPVEQGFALKATWNGKTEVRSLDSRGFNPNTIRFQGAYPLSFIEYADPALPLKITLQAFSPFIPLNVDDSSLPATLMRFKVKNTGAGPVDVEIGGWLENAVCPGAGAATPGQRRNRRLQGSDISFVESTAEQLPAGQEPALRPEIVFETFENGYGKWSASGDAFGTEPATGTLPGQQAVSGFKGKHLINTFLNGDASKGRLTSKEFEIERRYIAFLMGGGGHKERTCMNLLINGRVARTATGHNEEKLDWIDWDVSEFEGKTGVLEIVDEATEGWGHINVDQILFTDQPPSSRIPLDQREDFGSLALATVGDGANSFARASITGELPADLFSAAELQKEVVAPFSRKLIGGVGRKLKLPPGAEGEATFVLAWFFPGLLRSALGPLHELNELRRSYINRFKTAADVARYVSANLERLSGQTRLWHQTWYDSTLPYWFLDRTFASICTLATNTCYLFHNGRFYAFEGVYCCQGSCQHVWNYAQAVARIFPSLERDLRVRTDFGTAWHENGAIDYRGECARHVAHDGQCGVILRAWREHLMTPDATYLRATWPRIRKSIEYLIQEDGDENGLLEGEQYNTLDAAWFGPMAWISSLYIAALRAGEKMAEVVGDADFAARCRRIAERGTTSLLQQLYNGEYFIHKPDTAHPKATNTNAGCHIDQLMGQALAHQVGLPRLVPATETRSALEAIWKYNFTPDVGPFRQRSYIKGGRWYAMAGEGGVIMTTFPRGGVEQATGNGGFAHYFNEVWTGQEHQLAAHMFWEGLTDYGLIITRVLHDRHHASRRNPYNEVECSDHYTRAMSSYGSFLAACGFEYNGPEGHIGFAPRLTTDAFKAAFTAAEGWGAIEQHRESGRQLQTIKLHYGRLKLSSLAFEVPAGCTVSKVELRLNATPQAVKMEQSGRRIRLQAQTSMALQAGGQIEVVLVF